MAQNASSTMPGHPAQRHLLESPPLRVYPPLDTMPPLLTPEGQARWTGDLDTSETHNWTHVFHDLIRSRLPLPSSSPREKRAFDKLFCIGTMKSGTTTIGATYPRLGYTHQGRWTPPFMSREGLSFMDEWYQHHEYWGPRLKAVRQRIESKSAFEDWPWAFLYRVAKQLSPPDTRVGYILTLRPCRKHAESSAGYNNKRNENTPEWLADHCNRFHRRCHLHLLDVYNFFRERDGPINDLLVLDMDKARSVQNWRDLAAFVYGGSEAVYGASTVLPRPTQNLLARYGSLPVTNTRPSPVKKLTFCHSSSFVDGPINGKLLENLPPVPMNAFCNRVENLKLKKCLVKFKELKAYYGENMPHDRFLPSRWEAKHVADKPKKEESGSGAGAGGR